MIDVDTLAWERMGGLLPAVVQDADSGEVRMLGYMNREALDATIAEGFVTFFSRSRNALWRKGESSGHTLALVSIAADCDGDALLVTARPKGPTCHTGSTSCFGERQTQGTGFIADLERVLVERSRADPAISYTARLMGEGVKRIAQKVGEEGVETALAGAAGDDAELASEAADLVYHLTLLLQARGLGWRAVIDELRRRHADSSATASS
ncbi:MAG: bifunctional phosphoribosyl-AMP cyclohydrolase/phosphoribosyl-ATP diphosphatase HisIE [Sphingomonas sp.]|uniref:bifunctional phosphoribosyl-AMP cyclohydrolase/phosphoribosyl-ATP diphosphatase HisIE n=1 Tax=Sphingomonas sp. TaxID=28214 RepID=UPI0018386CF1|nr:bifunctional phosphoribosyl-AMP cyclohydrolase/phosphoribosyl-ATP diphosphatase HisIE [Sphingomonas sp.]MBA3668302.1 bifunctional phosphoribosyl-AMP cyclohydrolase/phosphoribosyl-ATP diphosphatase HisIE [Sphingomonas sp.]